MSLEPASLSFDAVLFQLVLITFAILTNGLFVAAEFSLARSRPSRFQSTESRQSLVVRVLFRAFSKLNDYISSAQIGITIASLMVGAVAEHLFSSIFYYVFVEIMKIQAAPITIEGMAFSAAIVLATCLHVIIGEFIPKTLSILHPEKVAVLTILPLHLFYKLTLPFVFILNKVALLLLYPFGVRTLSTGELSYSEDELKYLIKQSEKEGVIDSSEREMVDNVLEFDETVVREVMTPRTEIIGLERDQTISQAAELSFSKKLSKLIVFSNNLDHIEGVVYSVDLMQALYQGRTAETLSNIIKPIKKIPESKAIKDLLTEFKAERSSLALVIDEFGGTSGIVTLEDIIEELVGDISFSATEAQDETIEQVSELQWLIGGGTSIDDINEELESGFSDEHFDTIGGFVFGLLGREPKVGDVVSIEGWQFTVLKVERKIQQVQLDKLREEVENNLFTANLFEADTK